MAHPKLSGLSAATSHCGVEVQFLPPLTCSVDLRSLHLTFSMMLPIPLSALLAVFALPLSASSVLPIALAY
jgi:hypothetical protein